MGFAFGGVLFAVAVAFQIRCILIFAQMKDDVNRVLPLEAQIREFGPVWLRGTVIKTHRQLYPHSDLRRSLYRSWWVITVSFLAALACVVRFL